MVIKLKKYWEITKLTFKEFIEDDPMSYSAIIAYSTIFSLPAMLIIIIRIASLALGDEAITGELFNQAKGLIGEESAAQIQEMVQNTSKSEGGVLATIVGIITLIISATTVFLSIQTALNAIWKVKAKPEKGWVKLITNRILSFAMIVSFGFLLLVSLVLEAVIAILNKAIGAYLSDFAVIIGYIINYAFSIGLITLIFTVIFRFLPDAKIKWRDTWTGAFITALLFTVGKFLIGLYIGNSDISSTYGAAGSIVIILLWVYYASLIMLLGAEFTKVITEYEGRGIQPAEHAVKIETREIEKTK